MGETTTKPAGEVKPGEILFYMGSEFSPHVVKGVDPIAYWTGADDDGRTGVRFRLAPEGGGRSIDISFYDDVLVKVRAA